MPLYSVNILKSFDFLPKTLDVVALEKEGRQTMELAVTDWIGREETSQSRSRVTETVIFALQIGGHHE